MYVVEYRSARPSAPLLFWEISRDAPTGGEVEVVDEHPFGERASYDRSIIGTTEGLSETVDLLRERGIGELRVSEIEEAWEAARQNRPAPDRRVKPRHTVATDPATDVGGPPAIGATSSSPPIASSSRSWALMFVLFTIALIAGLYWFLLL